MPCVYLPGPAPAVTVRNKYISRRVGTLHIDGVCVCVWGGGCVCVCVYTYVEPICIYYATC